MEALRQMELSPFPRFPLHGGNVPDLFFVEAAALGWASIVVTASGVFIYLRYLYLLGSHTHQLVTSYPSSETVYMSVSPPQNRHAPG